MRRQGSDKQGTRVEGAAAIKGRRATKDSGRVDRRGRWTRAPATAPGVDVGGGEGGESVYQAALAAAMVMIR